ncbi:MAG: hypothetical protein IJ580_05095 [Prevotella sp.]|nr:hypothetical protein [Prevotella sp.]
MKKIYQKPAMKIVELRHKTCLLVGSGDDFDMGYIPCQTDHLNHLA